MDFINPDLTKKVLTALNPTKLVREDQIEKQKSIAQYPGLSSVDESQNRQMLKQSKVTVNQMIKSVVASAPTPGVKNNTSNIRPLNLFDNNVRTLNPNVTSESIEQFKERKKVEKKSQQTLPKKNQQTLPKKTSTNTSQKKVVTIQKKIH